MKIHFVIAITILTVIYAVNAIPQRRNRQFGQDDSIQDVIDSVFTSPGTPVQTATQPTRGFQVIRLHFFTTNSLKF